MGFSVADIFRCTLMVLNAMCILSERRLLQPWGLAGPALPVVGGPESDELFGGGSGGGVSTVSPAKQQISTVLSSIRTLLRWPLIVLNIVTGIFSLIFG